LQSDRLSEPINIIYYLHFQNTFLFAELRTNIQQAMTHLLVTLLKDCFKHCDEVTYKINQKSGV